MAWSEAKEDSTLTLYTQNAFAWHDVCRAWDNGFFVEVERLLFSQKQH